jgi:hypothetical protein
MATFFKSSKVWVLDFTYEGRPRRWFQAVREGADARAHFEAQLRDLYESRAKVIGVRLATDEEETQYLRGDMPKNMLCPTGRGGPRS